jgi:hypothetical protein
LTRLPRERTDEADVHLRSTLTLIALLCGLTAMPVFASPSVGSDWIRFRHVGTQNSPVPTIFITPKPFAVEGPYPTEMIVVTNADYRVARALAMRRPCPPPPPGLRGPTGTTEVSASTHSKVSVQCILAPEYTCALYSDLLKLESVRVATRRTQSLVVIGKFFGCEQNVFGPFEATNIAFPVFAIERDIALGDTANLEVRNPTSVLYCIELLDHPAEHLELVLDGRRIKSRAWGAHPDSGCHLIRPGETLSRKIDLRAAFATEQLQEGKFCSLVRWSVLQPNPAPTRRTLRICEAMPPQEVPNETNWVRDD